MRIIDDITKFIFVQDEPQPSDIIFLPGGSDPGVPEQAASLYADGFAPLLMPAGGVSIKLGRFAGVKRKRELYSGDYATECAFYTDVLLKNGVPCSAIVPEDRSGFTIENAMFSRQVADEKRLTIRRAIICCKSFHARRCLMLYTMAFPEAELFICPVDVYGVGCDTWHQTEDGIGKVLGEVARCGNQFPREIKKYLTVGVNQYEGRCAVDPLLPDTVWTVGSAEQRSHKTGGAFCSDEWE